MAEEKGKKVERVSGRLYAKARGLERAHDQATAAEQMEFELGLRAARDREDVERRRDKARWLVEQAEAELLALEAKITRKDAILQALQDRQAVLDGAGS